MRAMRETLARWSRVVRLWLAFALAGDVIGELCESFAAVGRERGQAETKRVEQAHCRELVAIAFQAGKESVLARQAVDLRAKRDS
jgi:hypothetical protein